LYGIDKAHQAIKRYKTVIIVEGIFDYFAFFNILQNSSIPIVISTLGTNLTEEAVSMLNDLGVENYVIAFDWDAAGKKAIFTANNDLGAEIHYFGGMSEGQDPAEKLKDVVQTIDGFSLKHLMDSAKRAQENSDKPINIHYITSGDPEKRNVVFESAANLNEDDLLPVPPGLSDPVNEYFYNPNDFIPLLSYDHGNKAALNEKLIQLGGLLEERPVKSKSDECFTLPAKFISTEAYDDLDAALVLWLKIVIEQQAKKHRLVATDETLATLLNTSRQTVNGYKQKLIKLGYLNVKRLKSGPGLSVNYFPKDQE
jgi:5S rRNA maturation endonuclease (ribonuclease M5)